MEWRSSVALFLYIAGIDLRVREGSRHSGPSVVTIGALGIGVRTDRVREPRNTTTGHAAVRRLARKRSVISRTRRARQKATLGASSQSTLRGAWTGYHDAREKS
jgi:hypothetical protein